jgi:hypothetical protein
MQTFDLEEALERIEQLEHALESRIDIEQAKGILAERMATSVDEAFLLLRTSARSNRMNIHELARRVIDEPKTPGPIILALARAERTRAAWMRELAEAHRARVEELHIALHEQWNRLEAARDRRHRRP